MDFSKLAKELTKSVPPSIHWLPNATVMAAAGIKNTTRKGYTKALENKQLLPKQEKRSGYLRDEALIFLGFCRIAEATAPTNSRRNPSAAVALIDQFVQYL